MPYEVVSYLKEHFGYGKMSPYVVSLIEADMSVQNDQTDVSDNYAKVVSIIRDMWFQKPDGWKAYQKEITMLKDQWKVDTHLRHSLYDTLNSITTEKLVELVKKWMRAAGAEEVNVDDIFSD